MNVNAYLGMHYQSPPCWALVAHVYAEELGHGVLDYKALDASIRSIAGAFRIGLHQTDHGFAQLDKPVDYCVVLLGKTARLGLHHCGVFFQGKVLHALDMGNHYDPMSVIRDQYQNIEFWAKS